MALVLALSSCFGFTAPWWSFIVETVTVLYIVKLVVRWTHGVCTSNARLDGKVAVVTGSSSGIGLEVAKDLARRGGRVYMAVPDTEAASILRDEMAKKCGNDQIFVNFIDLTSLSSVRGFVEQFLSKESRLDILINNAGMAAIKKSWTEDGLERQMECNYFGHFLLTHLLLDRLKASAPSRIITTSSMLHWLCRYLDLDNLDFKKPGTGEGVMELYAASKTCINLFTRELARRLEGTGVTANAVHPGTATGTAFLSNFPWYLRSVIWFITRLVEKTTEEAAQPVIHLAVSDEVAAISGQYFADCKVGMSSPVSKNDDLAKRLWTKSEELTLVA